MARVLTYTLRKAQERREEKRREQENQRVDLLSYVAGQQAMQLASSAEENAKQGLHRAHVLQRLKEEALLDRLEKAEQEHAASLQAAAEAERAALERETAAHEAERAAREKQHIIAESAELRELKQLIQAANVKAERDNQMVQQASAALAAEAAEADFHKKKAVELAEAAAQEELEALERLVKEKTARHGLKLQLAYKQVEEQEAQDLLLRERALVDAAAAREDEEDARSFVMLQAKQEQERIFIQQYLAERSAAQLNYALDQAAEDARVEEFQAQQRQREEDVAAKDAAKKARVEMQYESIKSSREAEMRAAEEEQRLFDLLRAAELDEASALEAQKRREQRELARRQMAEANALQIQFKAEQELAAKAEEEAYRQQLLTRFAEEDKLEQMGMQKRRLSQERHKREAEKLILKKRLFEAAAKEREAAEQAATQAEELRKEAIITAERERLLTEAGPLQKYLPRAIMADKKRLPPLTPAYLD